MPVSYEKKPAQQVRNLGKDPNSWPRESETIWRVMKSDSEDFEVGDLLLYLCSNHRGYAIVNLRSNCIHTGQISDGYTIQVVQDFSVKNVTLYVDNSAMP